MFRVWWCWCYESSDSDGLIKWNRWVHGVACSRIDTTVVGNLPHDGPHDSLVMTNTHSIACDSSYNWRRATRTALTCRHSHRGPSRNSSTTTVRDSEIDHVVFGYLNDDGLLTSVLNVRSPRCSLGGLTCSGRLLRSVMSDVWVLECQIRPEGHRSVQVLDALNE
jgi:hypothetical protein